MGAPARRGGVRGRGNGRLPLIPIHTFRPRSAGRLPRNHPWDLRRIPAFEKPSKTGKFSWRPPFHGRRGLGRCGGSSRRQGWPVWRDVEEAPHPNGDVGLARGGRSGARRRRERSRQAKPVAIGDAFAEPRPHAEPRPLPESVGGAGPVPIPSGNAVAPPAANGNVGPLTDSDDRFGVRSASNRIGHAGAGSSGRTELALTGREPGGRDGHRPPADDRGRCRGSGSSNPRSDDAVDHAQRSGDDNDGATGSAEHRTGQGCRPVGGPPDIRDRSSHLDQERVSGVQELLPSVLRDLQSPWHSVEGSVLATVTFVPLIVATALVR